ncbi:MAG: hypothetical protein QOH69_1854 [Actinomycetota bacterium]|jgi:hypothetical protein|nr:hypothetical protein [Actinomycetota bacterium]MDT5132422.1 hypothetical protein [Mycobacterium sp.]
MLEPVITARSFPLLNRAVFTSEPSDMAGQLGRNTRALSEMSRRDLFGRANGCHRNGCRTRTPGRIRLCVPGSAADGTTMALAPLARTSSASANQATTPGPVNEWRN